MSTCRFAAVLAYVLNKALTTEVALRGSGKAMAETQHPKVFYHGTQVAIHTLPEPLLDPKFSGHRDEGDPQAPHVFVTPDRLAAEIFALKVQEAVAISTHRVGGCIVFSSWPTDLKGGWLYTCPENPQYPFREIVFHGRHTNKWVSPEKVQVTSPVFIPGVNYLARRGVQVYLLNENMESDVWSNIVRSTAQLDLVDFYHQQVIVGNLRRVI
jgi:hypothetical protein